VGFAYQHDQSNTWFLIARGDQAPADGTFATWDTTTITDGTYQLRLRVFLSDGRTLESKVVGLRVRNYTAVETSTPEPLVTSVAGGTATLPADYIPVGQTITPLPANPAQVTSANLGDSLVRGGLIALLVFLILGVYLGLRGLFRRG
jgi:hypothetical protein